MVRGINTMAQETLYELYFAQVAGHIIDVRDITHISPVNYDRYEDMHAFRVLQKGAADYHSVAISSKNEDALLLDREALAAAHAKLWLPYPDEEKSDEATTAETTSPSDLSDVTPTKDESNV
jgi:hypothetical protein